MAFLNWTEKMSVGVPALDADHRKMVDLINGLNKTMKEGGSVDEVRLAINAVVDYTHYHFEMEERLLKLTKYPKFEAHEKCHRVMDAQVKVFADAFEADPDNFKVLELYDMMSRWLMQHILHEDMQYKDHLASALSRGRERQSA